MSVDENKASAVIGGLSITDPDDHWFTWAVVNDVPFTIVDGQLQLAEGQSLDREAIDDGAVAVTIRATDTGGASTEQEFNINVNDENEFSPAIPANQSQPIAENTSAGTSVLDVQAGDADATATLSGWTITGGNTDVDGDSQPAFNIDGTGKITVNDMDDLDREQVAAFSLSLTVSDGQMTSAQRTVTVAIVDVNEPPTLGLDNLIVLERVSGLPIGLLSVIDPEDNSQEFTVSDPFELAGGEVRLKPDRHLLTGAQVVVDVTAMDSNDPQVTITESFTLTVQANSNPAQNPRASQIPALQYDVDNNGSVVPQDVLLLITELNRNGSQVLDEAYVQPVGGFYYDGNGDNQITPLDALDVIKFINKEGFFTAGESEPEGESRVAQRELRGSDTNIAGALSTQWETPPELRSAAQAHAILPFSYIVGPAHVNSATRAVEPESTAPSATVVARIVPFNDAERAASELVDADSRGKFDFSDHLEDDLEEVLSDIAEGVLAGWADNELIR